jgi:hypothetical protein
MVARRVVWCTSCAVLCSAPLHTQEIDQASGVLMPFYDADLKLLYLAGKVRRRPRSHFPARPC